MLKSIQTGLDMSVWTILSSDKRGAIGLLCSLSVEFRHFSPGKFSEASEKENYRDPKEGGGGVKI